MTRQPGQVVIGTRSSPMAMAQAEIVRSQILSLDPGLTVTFTPVKTTADLWLGDLSTIGGKGLFTRQIDQMLMENHVDVAVHCVKDIPGDEALPETLMSAAFLKRDDVRDVLVTTSKFGPSLNDLPPNARIGTSSVRRRAQLLGIRNDLDISPLRGPVGAGALVVQCRRDDPLQELLAKLDHPQTRREVEAERAMLFGLQGHCNSPIAGFCHTAPDGQLKLTGRVFSSDGATSIESHSSAEPGEGSALGAKVSSGLLAQGARELIDHP